MLAVSSPGHFRLYAHAQQPTFALANYDQSSAFKFRDEAACANVIVLLFAKVLRLTYSTADALPLYNWALLEADIERWNDRRCRLFQPIYAEDPEIEGGKPFPLCCMLNAPQGRHSFRYMNSFAY